MKGKVPEDELKNLPNDVEVEAIYALNVRDMDASRSLVIIKNKSAYSSSMTIS